MAPCFLSLTLPTPPSEKRGLYYEDELTALVELAGTPNDMQAQAAKALALFLHGTPSEFTLSHETISSAIAQSKECLVYMLDEAEKGHVRFSGKHSRFQS